VLNSLIPCYYRERGEIDMKSITLFLAHVRAANVLEDMAITADINNNVRVAYEYTCTACDMWEDANKDLTKIKDKGYVCVS
jgi:predicted SprT family Zn-dependent metalloprotease